MDHQLTNGIQRKAIVVATREALENPFSGARIRLNTILSILEEQNFEVSIFKPFGYLRLRPKAHVDLGVVVSFPAAWVSFALRRKVKVLWLDSIDSQKLTKESHSRTRLRQFLASARERVSSRVVPDMVTFISGRDRDADRNLYSASPTYVFPNSLELPEVSNSNEQRFVFVGPGNYLPNREAVEFLSEEIKKGRIPRPLVVVGSGYGELNMETRQDGVEFVGIVPERELYRERDIHLAPLTKGAGIKNKVAIPLLLGLKVVGTEEAFNGLRPVPNMFLAKDLSEFSIRVLQATQASIDSNTGLSNIFELDEKKELLSFLGSKMLYEGH